MLKVDLAKWNQTADDLREAALRGPQARTRERFLALYELTQQDRGATAVARRLGRHLQTLIRWVHRYNAEGAGVCAHGRRLPFFDPLKDAALDRLIRVSVAAAAAPVMQREAETGRLTLVANSFSRSDDCC